MKKSAITTLFLLVSLYCYAQTDTIPTIDKKKPKAVYLVGDSQVAVWENTLPDGKVRKNFSISRRYKTEHGDWKTSHSFNAAQLLELRSAIDKAISEESVEVRE